MPDPSTHEEIEAVARGALVEALATLQGSLRGALLQPGQPGYDRARAVWNAMVERRPAAIARCAGVADVIRCVEVARDHGLSLSVKGGGHHIGGHALCDGGLTIDLSELREVRVDPHDRHAIAGPGATLRDVDHETQAFGLAVPLGINSTTGLAGLTLGGGFGWLSRKYGLTIDHLRSADVVLADGSWIRTDASHEPDLFWAIRGGGGNFGVVTAFELDLSPVGPEIMAGLIVFPADEAPAVLARYRQLAATLPDEAACWAVLRQAPPLPFVPASHHGRPVLILAAFHLGPPAAAEPMFAAVQALGTPLGAFYGPQPYTAWQQTFDPLLAPGARNYWKSHNFTELSDGALDAICATADELPSDQTEIFLGQLGGAAGRVAPDATAFPHRDARFVMNVHTRWTDPRDDARCVAWARALYAAITPYATGGVYSNFVPEGDDVVRAVYGVNYDRLATLKARYDPTNLFRNNQNIRPALH